MPRSPSSFIARDHLAAFLVHDLRVGGGAARHLEEGFERKAETIGEDEALGQGGAVQTEDEVDGELRLVAVAERAEEKAALADGGENVVDLGDARLVSRQEADGLAPRHLLAGSRQRAFEERGAAGTDALAQRPDALRIARADAQEHRALRRARRFQQAAGTFENVFHLLRIEDGEDETAAGSAELRERAGRPGAKRGKERALAFIDIVAGDRQSGGDQAARDGAADQPDPDDSDRVRSFAHAPNRSRASAWSSSSTRW
jgi:hypothetical protein